MIYDRVKVTKWGNIETSENFHGIAVRDGRKWGHCVEGNAPKLFSDLNEATEYAKTLEVSLKARGLWKVKKDG